MIRSNEKRARQPPQVVEFAFGSLDPPFLQPIVQVPRRCAIGTMARIRSKSSHISANVLMTKDCHPLTQVCTKPCGFWAVAIEEIRGFGESLGSVL
jgi:hypothetical protein